jgi:hypothetical protein
VEFWHEKHDVFLAVLELDAFVVEDLHTLPDIFVPLARNIVGDVEALERAASEAHEEHIVHVKIPIYLCSGKSERVIETDTPFSLLQIAHGIWALHVVSGAVDRANA